ncbi:MAG: tetratricopeptide repeat protein [Candidatus Obscuribacterales bacterium]
MGIFRTTIAATALTCALVALQSLSALAAAGEPQSESFRKGESFFADTKYAEALVQYQDAARAEPDNAKVHAQLGAALTALQRFDEAIVEEQTATRLDPSSDLPHAFLGQIYTSQGRTDDAFAEVKTALQLNPKSFKSHCALGYVLMQTGKLQESLKVYRLAAQLKPDDAKPYLNMALLLGLLGDKRGSIAASMKAIELNPRMPHGYITLANTYIETNDAQKAVEAFNRALVVDPQNLMAISGLGEAYRIKGDLKNAIAKQQEALAISPNFNVARCRLALNLVTIGDKNGAQREYLEAIRQTPNEAGVLCGYALFLEGQRNIPGAIDYYKQALAANPHWHIARERLEKLAPGVAITPARVAASPVAAVAAPPPVATSMPAAAAAVSSVVNQPVKDKWALVIGISKFQNPAYNLKYAAKDAQDFYNFLVKEANFRPDHVKLLINEQATRKNIMASFGSRWLPNVVEQGDLAVVYVSTHGTPAASDSESKNYIVAYDTEADDPYSSGVDMDEVYRRIKDGVKTNRALIVLDTCYSGGAVPQGKGLVRCDNFDLKKVQLGSGHLIVSSSNTGEKSWESKRYENGVFTRNLIDALRANGTKINVPEAFKQMQDKVRWEVKCDYGAAQIPQMGGNWSGAELILSVAPTDPRTVAPAAPAASIPPAHR